MLMHCPKLTGNNYLIYQSSHIGENFSFHGKGAFNNYVDRILQFFDIFYTLSVGKNRHF